MVEIFFGALLVLCGGSFTYHYFAMNAKLERARRWPSVTGTVLESRVKRGSGSKPSYRARIAYTYAVNGREYESRRIVTGGETAGGAARAESRSQKYPEGSRPTVYYDPENPSDACLERVREAGVAELVGGVLGVLLGVALLARSIGDGPP